MNEIDDLYKQESEDIDTAFLEKMKGKKHSEGELRNYLRNVKKSRDKFNSKYERHLKKEMKKARRPKKKKKKRDKFKHLEVKHFNFEFNSFQKVIFRLNVFFFDVKRILVRVIVKIVPRILLYAFYKTAKAISFQHRIFRDWIDYNKNKIQTKIKKFIAKSIEIIKSAYDKLSKKIKEIVAKIQFWKKKSEGKEGEDGEGEEGEKKSEEEKKED